MPELIFLIRWGEKLCCKLDHLPLLQLFCLLFSHLEDNCEPEIMSAEEEDRNAGVTRDKDGNVISEVTNG